MNFLRRVAFLSVFAIFLYALQALAEDLLLFCFLNHTHYLSYK